MVDEFEELDDDERDVDDFFLLLRSECRLQNDWWEVKKARAEYNTPLYFPPPLGALQSLLGCFLPAALFSLFHHFIHSSLSYLHLFIVFLFEYFWVYLPIIRLADASSNFVIFKCIILYSSRYCLKKFW